MKYIKIDKKIIRILTIILSIVGILALMLLTASLSTLSFLPGAKISLDEIIAQRPLNLFLNADLLLSCFISSIVIMIPLLIILLAFSSRARGILKKQLRSVLSILILLLAFRALESASGLNDIQGGQFPSLNLPEVGKLPTYQIIGDDIDTYLPNNLLSWQGYIVGFLISIIIGVVFLILLEKNRSISSNLNSIVTKTIKEIKSGREWDDAVIRCYAKMSSVVSQKRNLDRKKSMTPKEFSQILIETGLPETPVMRLTRLFEKARYGSKSPQMKEADEAIACLSQITDSLETLE